MINNFQRNLGLAAVCIAALVLYSSLGSPQVRLCYLFQCYVIGDGHDLEYPEGYSGIWKTWHPNGRLKHRIAVREGLNWGVYREYYRSGTLRLEARLVEGLFDGMTREFYDADSGGVIKAELVYYQEQLLSEVQYAPDKTIVATIVHDELGTLPDEKE